MLFSKCEYHNDENEGKTVSTNEEKTILTYKEKNAWLKSKVIVSNSEFMKPQIFPSKYCHRAGIKQQQRGQNKNMKNIYNNMACIKQKSGWCGSDPIENRYKLSWLLLNDYDYNALSPSIPGMWTYSSMEKLSHLLSAKKNISQRKINTKSKSLLPELNFEEVKRDEFHSKRDELQ
jgi:hypothetical protein